MPPPLTIKEIAAMAGISRSTVSRVLNNHPNVRAAVRDHVLQIIDQHNYAPGAAARNLARSRTDIIGLIIPRSAALIFSDPFFSTVIQGINETCNSRGYFLMLSTVAAEAEESFYNRIVRGRHFDGIIMVASDIGNPILPLLLHDRTPLALIGRHPSLQDIPYVDVENLEGARQAVKHLIQLGHSRIATITGSLQMSAGIDRRDGYTQSLLGAGIASLPELIVVGDFTQESGYHGMRQLLALPQPPTAVFVASDTTAIGALWAVHEAGLGVPQDIALVGFDDLPSASRTEPPLTTVRQNTADLGAAAVAILIDQIENPGVLPRSLSLPTELIIRASCGAKGK